MEAVKTHVDDYVSQLCDEGRYERLERLRNLVLEYVNARMGTCAYFSWPIDSRDKTYRALRIYLDLWDDPSMIDGFIDESGLLLPHEDLELVASWKDMLAGPMFCMETDGDRARFLCDGFAIEAVSLGRTWDDMVPYAPDLVITSLVPYEGVVVLGGFTTKHYGPMQGPGLKRITREFRKAARRNVVKTADDFIAVSRAIRWQRAHDGVDVNSWLAFMDFVDFLNEMTSDSCFPYEPTLLLRD